MSATVPWPRPRRSGALRRAQYARSEARAVSHLLKAFSELQHRGCSHTKLGTALMHALLSPAAAAAAAAPMRPPGIFFANVAQPGVWERIPPPRILSPHLQVQGNNYIKGGIPVPLRATSCDEPLPLICIELQKILGPEIFAAQAAGVDTLGTDKAARLCHIIGIIDLAFAHNV